MTHTTLTKTTQSNAPTRREKNDKKAHTNTIFPMHTLDRDRNAPYLKILHFSSKRSKFKVFLKFTQYGENKMLFGLIQGLR